MKWHPSFLSKGRFSALSIKNRLSVLLFAATCLWITLFSLSLYKGMERHEASWARKQESIVQAGMERRLSDFQLLLDHAITDILQSEIFYSYFYDQSSASEEFVRKAFGQLILDIPEVDKLVLIGGNTSFIFSLSERLQISFGALDLENILYNSYGRDIHYDSINYASHLEEANAYSLESDLILSLLDHRFTYLKRFPSPNRHNASLLVVLKNDFSETIAGAFHPERAALLERSEPLPFLQQSVLAVSSEQGLDAVGRPLFPHKSLLVLLPALLSCLAAVLCAKFLPRPTLKRLHQMAVQSSSFETPVDLPGIIEDISSHTVRREYTRTLLIGCLVPMLLWLGTSFSSLFLLYGQAGTLSREALLDEISTFRISYGRIASRVAEAADAPSTRILFGKSDEALTYQEYKDAIQPFTQLRSEFPSLGEFGFYSISLESLYNGIHFDAPSVSFVPDALLQRLSDSRAQIIPLGIRTQDGGFLVLFGRPVTDAVSGVTLGYLLFSVTADSIVYDAPAPLYLAYTNLLAASDSRISHPLPEQFSRSVSKIGRLQEVSIAGNNGLPAYHITLTPVSHFSIGYRDLGTVEEFNAAFLPFYLVLLLSALLFSAFVTLAGLHLSFSRPLEETYLRVAQLYRDRQTGRQAGANRNEFTALVDYFQYLLEKNQRLSDENWQNQLRQRELEYAEKEARFNALICQINPHFLFNTLEIIKWSAYGLGDSQIVEITMALSRLYQYNIITGKPFASFAEEIETLKSYIFIQQKRFPDSFSVLWQIENGLEDVPVLRLLLQPLVENCIEHGFFDLPYPGIIRIEAFRRKDCLHLSVSDNGHGIPSEQLAQLRELLASPHSPSGQKYVALANIAQRLSLYYDGKASIRIPDTGEAGVTVLLCFPANTIAE